jgi:hypothetical protein
MGAIEVQLALHFMLKSASAQKKRDRILPTVSMIIPA